MSHGEVDTAVILGAGFSKCANLPLTDELSDHILSERFGSPVDKAITQALKEFLGGAFCWREQDNLPSLEDIFTMIDLSANSGHNLGQQFNPGVLRALRRMLIYRVFTILDQNYERSTEIDEFLKKMGFESPSELRTHFIVLNWDIVLERHLALYTDIAINYCIEASPWQGLQGLSDSVQRSVSLVKVHGSSNWVYCDNCRTLFYDRSRKLSLAIRAGLKETDFRLFDEKLVNTNFDTSLGLQPEDRDCRRCQTAVGPHIVTFSYRKSFRTHAFARSWHAAEQILTEAKKWIFIGYSLPEADYEFKHLLKTSELKFGKGEQPQKSIEVIILGDDCVKKKYERFFGSRTINVCQDGLAGYVKQLQSF